MDTLSGSCLNDNVQIFNAIFSVFQGAVGVTTSAVRTVLALFWSVVSFVLHNIVVIGLVVGKPAAAVEPAGLPSGSVG